MKNRFEELASLWLDKAKDDILWAKDSLADEHYSGVCFLTQQIMEKSLKAYLYFVKEELIRTHNLLRLLDRCRKHDSDFEKLRKNCGFTNDFYIDTRYPDIEEITQLENEEMAREALTLAEEIKDFVERKIKT